MCNFSILIFYINNIKQINNVKVLLSLQLYDKSICIYLNWIYKKYFIVYTYFTSFHLKATISIDKLLHYVKQNKIVNLYKISQFLHINKTNSMKFKGKKKKFTKKKNCTYNTGCLRECFISVKKF